MILQNVLLTFTELTFVHKLFICLEGFGSLCFVTAIERGSDLTRQRVLRL